MRRAKKIPKPTITRLSLYYRQLELMKFDGYRMVSSEKLAWLCQVNPAQVRKDLGYFGEFGVRGVGYDVQELHEQIKKILAINKEWNTAIAGIGRLGSALLQHKNLAERGFKCVAAFDIHPEKIGIHTPTGVVIQHIDELQETVKERNIKIGIITVPPHEAQKVADYFFEAQVYAILNFSPTRIQAPDCCLVENIDFTVKLDILTYKLTKGLN